MNTVGICEALAGKIRGKPVAIARFEQEPPAGFQGLKVDPCQILRHAMDDGKRVYFDREHQDCIHGAYITGVHPGNEQIRIGQTVPPGQISSANGQLFEPDIPGANAGLLPNITQQGLVLTEPELCVIVILIPGKGTARREVISAAEIYLLAL